MTFPALVDLILLIVARQLCSFSSVAVPSTSLIFFYVNGELVKECFYPTQVSSSLWPDGVPQADSLTKVHRQAHWLPRGHAIAG